jgi:hypothetical protein
MIPPDILSKYAAKMQEQESQTGSLSSERNLRELVRLFKTHVIKRDQRKNISEAKKQSEKEGSNINFIIKGIIMSRKFITIQYKVQMYYYSVLLTV